jgi:hypothetical protein
MKYETPKRKLLTSVESSNKNGYDADALNKMDMVEKPENVLKTARVIHLIKGYNFTFGIVSVPFDSRVTVIKGGPNNVNPGGGLGG